MLFKLVHGVDPFELNPGALALEAYKTLTASQFIFTCLVADSDHDNPLRLLPERQRREKAAKVAGYGYEAGGKRFDRNARDIINGKIERVEKAIVEYHANQYDADKANLEAVLRQIEEARLLAKEDRVALAKRLGDPELAYKLAERAIKLTNALPGLIETRDTLIKLIKEKEPVQMNILTGTAADLAGIPEEDGEGEEMSTIDRYTSKL